MKAQTARRWLRHTHLTQGLILGLLGSAGLGSTPASAQWVEAPGSGWMHLAAFHTDTRTRFDFRGDKEPIFADGHIQNLSLFLTSAVGLGAGADLWAEVPIHRLAFTDAIGRREKTGLGDPAFHLRWSPSAWLPDALPPLAVRGGLRLPVGDFPVEAEVIPLGEGQRDWELLVETGASFYPRPIYAQLWMGHRWRERNETSLFKPGDEWFFLSAVGASRGKLGGKITLEGWQGGTPFQENIPISSARREMLQALVTGSVSLGGGALEAGARIPLAGKNLPAGPGLILGYFRTFHR
ncbi:MAG: hypothetical protein WEA09_14445 [Gemmatimonadota bacterium]